MEKLTLKEINKLQAHKNMILNLFFKWGGGFFVASLFISSVPVRFLPSKRISNFSNSNNSIIDDYGVLPTLIVLIVVLLVLILYLYYSLKYPEISKDLIEKEKITLNVRIKKIIYKKGSGPQEIDLFFTPRYNSINKVSFIGEDNLPPLYKNQEVKIVVTKNAFYPLNIKPKNNVSEILHQLKNLDK